MKQVFDEEDIKGKTIIDVCDGGDNEDDDLFLVFSDNTFARISATGDYEGETSVYVSGSAIKPKITRWSKQSNALYIRLGYFTQEQVDAEIALLEAAAKREWEAQEEKLKSDAERFPTLVAKGFIRPW